MNRGYIHLWRKSLDAGWIKNHELWAFWSWCLLKATYREYDAIVGLQRVHLKPGQFVFGLKKASQETGLSIRQIRTILDFLKKAENLTIKTTNKFSIITIINWDIYQGSETQNDTQNDKQPTNNRQHTRIKSIKSIKRESVKTLAPENFSITDKSIEYARQKGFTGDLETLTERFLNHHRAKGSKFASWESAWKNWLLKELEFNPPGPADLPLNGGKTLDEVLS